MYVSSNGTITSVIWIIQVEIHFWLSSENIKLEERTEENGEGGGKQHLPLGKGRCQKHPRGGAKSEGGSTTFLKNGGWSTTFMNKSTSRSKPRP